MNGFKRFVLIVYVICSALLLAALVLPWYGLWTKQAAALIELDWYFWTLVGLFAISALGLLIFFLRALFAPRNARVVIAKLDGGKITVTRDAIVSQVEHIVDRDGSCEVDKVKVTLPRGKVSVNARLRPAFGVDVAQRSRELHGKLEEGLGLLCGSACIKKIVLTFIESSGEANSSSRSSNKQSSAPANYARSSAKFKSTSHSTGDEHDKSKKSSSETASSAADKAQSERLSSADKKAAPAEASFPLSSKSSETASKQSDSDHTGSSEHSTDSSK